MFHYQKKGGETYEPLRLKWACPKSLHQTSGNLNSANANVWNFMHYVRKSRLFCSGYPRTPRSLHLPSVPCFPKHINQALHSDSTHSADMPRGEVYTFDKL